MITPHLDATLRRVFRELGMGQVPMASWKPGLKSTEDLKWECLPDDFIGLLRINGYDVVEKTQSAAR